MWLDSRFVALRKVDLFGDGEDLFSFANTAMVEIADLPSAQLSTENIVEEVLLGEAEFLDESLRCGNDVADIYPGFTSH